LHVVEVKVRVEVGTVDVAFFAAEVEHGCVQVDRGVVEVGLHVVVHVEFFVVFVDTGCIVEHKPVRRQVPFGVGFGQILLELGTVERGCVQSTCVLECHVADAIGVVLVFDSFGHYFAAESPHNVELLPLLEPADEEGVVQAFFVQVGSFD